MVLCPSFSEGCLFTSKYTYINTDGFSTNMGKILKSLLMQWLSFLQQWFFLFGMESNYYAAVGKYRHWNHTAYNKIGLYFCVKLL